VPRRILVLDPARTAWRELERSAAAVRCEVVCVPDAAAALGALVEGPFDLVLCDLRAPDGDLRELLARLVVEPVASLAPAAEDFALNPARKRFEHELIRRALRATDGNRTRAARLLEISHRALLYKLKEHGLGDGS
jgi:DNA-binding NtrC family response regulator